MVNPERMSKDPEVFARTRGTERIRVIASKFTLGQTPSEFDWADALSALEDMGRVGFLRAPNENPPKDAPGTDPVKSYMVESAKTANVSSEIRMFLQSIKSHAESVPVGYIDKIYSIVLSRLSASPEDRNAAILIEFLIENRIFPESPETNKGIMKKLLGYSGDINLYQDYVAALNQGKGRKDVNALSIAEMEEVVVVMEKNGIETKYAIANIARIKKDSR